MAIHSECLFLLPGFGAQLQARNVILSTKPGLPASCFLLNSLPQLQDSRYPSAALEEYPDLAMGSNLLKLQLLLHVVFRKRDHF